MDDVLFDFFHFTEEPEESTRIADDAIQNAKLKVLRNRRYLELFDQRDPLTKEVFASVNAFEFWNFFNGVYWLQIQVEVEYPTIPALEWPDL